MLYGSMLPSIVADGVNGQSQCHQNLVTSTVYRNRPKLFISTVTPISATRESNMRTKADRSQLVLELSVGNLIGQHGGSARPSKSDRKAKML